jgi:hypothetical protein
MSGKLPDIELGTVAENPMNASSSSPSSSPENKPQKGKKGDQNNEPISSAEIEEIDDKDVEKQAVPEKEDELAAIRVSKEEMTFRRGGNKVTTLEKALSVNITNGRMKTILKRFQSEDDMEAKKKAIIAFKAATDPSYLIQSSVEEIWMAVKRREAWAQVPFKMIATSCAQVILCFIALLAYNAPVNLSTLVMAIIYAITMASVNPFDVTCDLVGIIEKEGRKLGRKHGFIPVYILGVFLIPVFAVGFGVTIVFDFFVGKVLDCSYGSLVNIIIDAIVKATAISVGLRSSNPISAIQTFVGFDFISNMDEVIIETIDIDMKAATSLGNATPDWNQSKRSKMTRVRVTLYILIPAIVGFFSYTTAYNVCYVFCNDN